MESSFIPDIETPALPTAEPMHLSLVIPAYNESDRLGRTMEAAVAFLKEKPYRSELILVLDGCTDDTARVAGAYTGAQGNCDVRVIDNAVNRGKGACVRDGMLAAAGRYRFFTDADLSYPLHQIDTFLDTLITEGGIAIASRERSSVAYQRPVRRLITRLSRMVMNRLFVPGIKDTQAGFKGFTQEAARDLFSCQQLQGFCFDAELLHIASMRRYAIHPMPVEWEDVAGSKVVPARDIFLMGLDLARIVYYRVTGRYDRAEGMHAAR